LIALPPQEVEILRSLVEMPVQERWFREVAKKGLDGRALLNEVRQLIDERYEREAKSKRVTAEQRP